MVKESPAQPEQSDTAFSSTWKRAGLISCLSVVGICLLFSDTIRSMITIWRSEPYTYGALIIPIFFWLIWTKRRQFSLLAPHPEYRVLLLMLPAGALWLLANLVYLQYLQQIALISLLIFAIWCILGTQVAKAFAFPLGFLLFAAPPLFIVEPLYPIFTEFTADFVVGLLQSTGISVYREGKYLSVPNGNWSIEEQCSGLQYLTASVILGIVYAYHFYRSLVRRLLFVALAVAFPILANGLRAYIIVVIGYLSDMRLAIGIDHVVYGWLFYFVVSYSIFALGSYWWESSDQPVDKKPTGHHNGSTKDDPRRSRLFVGAGMASLLVAAMGPGIATSVGQIEPPSKNLELQSPRGVDGWQRAFTRYWQWSPRVHRFDGDLHAFYRRGDQVVSLYLAQFQKQRRYAQPFGQPNVLIVPEAQSWRNDIRSPKDISVGETHFKVLHAKTVTVLRGGRWGDLLVWYWYRIGDRHLTSPFYAKLLDAWALVTGGRRDLALVAVATIYEGDLEASERVLRSFLGSMDRGVAKTLDESIARSGGR